MKTIFVIAFTLLVSLAQISLAQVSSAQAKDVALILNEEEQTALLQMIDAAVRAQGLQVAPNAVYLANKIKVAPAVTEQKQPMPEPKKEEPPQ